MYPILLLPLLLLLLLLSSLTTMIQEWHQLLREEEEIALVASRNSISLSMGRERPVVVAYCLFRQVRQEREVVRESEWIAKFFGANLFPERGETIFKPVVALPQYLPSGVSAESDLGLRMLGLLDTDIRYCEFGSYEMVRLMTANGRGEFLKIDMKNHTLQFPEIFHGEWKEGGVWTHHKRLFWPDYAEIIVDSKTKKPLKPFLIRQNVEPWFQSVRGLNLWFESKRDENLFDTDKVILYHPTLVNSFGSRIPPNPGDQVSYWSQRFGALFNSLEEIILRPINFDPAKVRSAKKYFATMVNSQCRSESGARNTEGTVIRELFTYALHAESGKPVHNLGLCPVGPDGALKAGLKVSTRVTLAYEYSSKGAIDVYRDHKFCIVFENSHVEGYLSEKLLNGYASTSIPVYFGSGESTAFEFLNPEAFIHCNIPMEISSDKALKASKKKWCAQKLIGTECEELFRSKLSLTLKPYFDACIKRIIDADNDDRLYDHIISQNLVPHGRNLSGIFNGTLSAQLVRTVYTVLGFDDV